MKTIAQQLNVKEFPFEIKDSKCNLIYREDSKGYWYKREFDTKGNEIYFEDSDGYWSKREHDSNNNEIYYENSDGEFTDKRPKQETLEEAKNNAWINYEYKEGSLYSESFKSGFEAGVEWVNNKKQ